MRAALCVLALAGCNAFFELEKTYPADAAVAFDAPPPTCPAIGAGPPVFTQDPVVIGAMHCLAYTTSVVRGTAITKCDSGLVEGAIGSGTFAPLAITIPAGFTLTSARISPSGDELYAVAGQAGMASSREIRRFRRVGTEAFQPVGFVPFSPFEAALLETVSPPTATAEPHVIVHLFDPGGTSTFVELHEAAGVWTEDRRETLAQVGSQSMGFPSLSPDGLRMVFAGTLTAGGSSSVLYRERGSVADAFGPPVMLSVADAQRLWPHLAPDCSRLYFSRIDTLEYVAQ